MSVNKKYYYEINFTRAIASLAIVMIHVTAGYYYTNGKEFTLTLEFFNHISRFGTPIFAFLSGFLVYNQIINRNFEAKRFLQSRLIKIVIPFFIWSLVYMLLKLYYDKLTVLPITNYGEAREFIYWFMTGKANYHLYFLVLVIQFYILFLIIHKFHSKLNLIVLVVLSLLINYIFIEFTIDIREGLVNRFINERVFLFHWVSYFFLGGLFVYYWDSLMEKVRKHFKLLLLLGFIVIIGAVLEYRLAGWVESNRFINNLNVPILILVLSGIYFYMGRFSKLRDLIVKIGNLSMGIYLVHPFVLFIFRNEAIFSVLYKDTRYFIITYILTILFSVGLIKLITKLPFSSYIVTVAGKKSN